MRRAGRRLDLARRGRDHRRRARLVAAQLAAMAADRHAAYVDLRAARSSTAGASRACIGRSSGSRSARVGASRPSWASRRRNCFVTMTRLVHVDIREVDSILPRRTFSHAWEPETWSVLLSGNVYRTD